MSGFFEKWLAGFLRAMEPNSKLSCSPNGILSHVLVERQSPHHNQTFVVVTPVVLSVFYSSHCSSVRIPLYSGLGIDSFLTRNFCSTKKDIEAGNGGAFL